MSRSTGEGIPIFVWAAWDTPDTPPDRLEVTSCRDCSALVPADRADRHARWHRHTERARPTPNGSDDRRTAPDNMVVGCSPS
ncbi:MAG: hypothetical protein JO100_11915 [Pseudonocardia sp.]|nr:hypothetical protein [Pseudonocardia sp.]